MKDLSQIPKLVDRLQRFSTQLGKIKDFTVHQHINHFYYMEKKAELLALSEQLTETQNRLIILTNIIEKEYTSTVSQWVHDVRWLNRYQIREKKYVPD